MLYMTKRRQASIAISKTNRNILFVSISTSPTSKAIRDNEKRFTKIISVEKRFSEFKKIIIDNISF